MSVKQLRQDRRIVGRSPVTHHNHKAAPGHDFPRDNGEKADAPTISDEFNGQGVGRGRATPEGASAPGSNGPALSDYTASNITSSW